MYRGSIGVCRELGLLPLPVLNGEKVGVRGEPCAELRDGPLVSNGACARQATIAETKLWFALRDRRLGGFKFVRQEAIGSYIVDFVCREKKLIIEVDGGQHAGNTRDRVRDRALTADGYHVLRFWNSDVLNNRNGVLSLILAKLEEPET